MATDITTASGKGPRKHRNVSTPTYRAGWERIFGISAVAPVAGTQTTVKRQDPKATCSGACLVKQK